LTVPSWSCRAAQAAQRPVCRRVRLIKKSQDRG
jgi:hypothetical protein